MIDFAPLYKSLKNTALDAWAATLPEYLNAAFSPSWHGDYPAWQKVLNSLPAIKTDDCDLNAAAVRIGNQTELNDTARVALKQSLQKLHPWRKGPFELFGLKIDAEWRSDLKWARLEKEIAPLDGRRVLDVGAGNGYYLWRMAGAGADLALGIDPMLLYVMQFYALKHFCPVENAHLIPMGIEAFPAESRFFDTVFSMGVLYHRRSPLDHLLELSGCLRPGGELVLETLVIEGGEGATLLPRGRYAKMRNVWFIPSVPTLISWLKRCGFKDLRCVDESFTTVQEQRATDWMQWESLADFLDPDDPARTIEGYPGPKRAILIARNG